MANLKEIAHAHMPSGRYEQYRAKHDYLLQQTQGEARYMLEKQLDTDAKKYASRKVAIEVIGTAFVATGAFFITKSLLRGTFTKDLDKIKDFFPEQKQKVIRAWKALSNETGKEIGKGVMKSVKDGAPELAQSLQPEAMMLGEAVATGATVAIQQRTGDVLSEARNQLDMKFTGLQLAVLNFLFKETKHS